MNKAADAAREPAFEFRFGQVGLVQIRLGTTDADAIYNDLVARVAVAPSMFARGAVCLDLGALEQSPGIGEMRAVLDAIRRAGMLPVGVAQGGAGEALAPALDLPVMTQFRAQSRPAPAEPPSPATPAKPPPEVAEFGVPALLHHQPVRSGQSLYARHRDLVVTGVVAAGAEVMADGCVHIYGSLRGRAMAGARGDAMARLFCQEFHAELVSIAGVFRVFETIPAELIGRPVQAWLDGDDLRVARIGG